MDGERDVVETSIIIEYLQLVHPGPVRLLPADPMAALDVRFLDRFFDLHVMNAMQLAVDSALTGDPVKRQEGLALAKEKLERAYAWLEGQLCGQDLGRGRGLHAGGLRGRALAVLCGLDAPDFRGLSRAARLPRAVACPALLRPGGEEARPFRPLFPLGAPDRD